MSGKHTHPRKAPAPPSDPGEATVRQNFSVWTVYDHPRDFPSNFVARKHEVVKGATRPTANFFVGPDLASIRAILLAGGLACFKRDKTDDPCIIETWM
jgi:hypothetical protein